MRGLVLGAAFATVIFASAAPAKSIGGKSFPASIKVADTALKLNGVGLREATIFNVNVYAAGLYVTTPSKDPAVLLAGKGPWQLVLKVVRDVAQSKMEDAFAEGFEKNGHKKFARKGKKLATYMGDVKDGDTVKLTFVPGKGVSVSKNGKWLGQVKAEGLGPALMSVWIGRSPPNAELKRGLLGK